MGQLACYAQAKQQRNPVPYKAEGRAKHQNLCCVAYVYAAFACMNVHTHACVSYTQGKKKKKKNLTRNEVHIKNLIRK